MSDIQERLRVLLGYWIEHNSEHEKEFRDWAEKAMPLSHEITQQLQEAATRMAEVSNNLVKAQQALTNSRRERQNVSGQSL